MSDGQDPAGAPLAKASSAAASTPAPSTPGAPAETPARGAPAAPGEIPASPGRWVLPTRRLLWWEVIAVFAVSLGGSGLYAFVDLIGSLTASKSLGKQTATLNGSLAPGRPTLDLFLQLTNTLLGVAPVVLALYLIAREGESPSVIGLDGKRPC